MDWGTIIVSLGGSFLTGGAFISLLYRRENKRAKQLENETTASAQWRELYEQAEAKVSAQSVKIDELYRKIGHLRDQNNGLTTQNAVLKILKCKRIGCTDRQPPIDKKNECNFKNDAAGQDPTDTAGGNTEESQENEPKNK